MISIHSRFLYGLAFIVSFVGLHDTVVLAFAPLTTSLSSKQLVVPTQNRKTDVALNEGRFRSNDEWAREMKALQVAQAQQRVRLAREAEERNREMAKAKYDEEKAKSARIAEIIAEKKAADFAMARAREQAKEAQLNAKAEAVARVIEEKRAIAEARAREKADAKRALQEAREIAAINAMEEKRAQAEAKARQEWEAKMALQQARAEAIANARKVQQAAAETRRFEAMQANAAIRNAMAEAAIRNIEQKSRVQTEKDIETARAKAYFQARAASVSGGYSNEFNEINDSMRENVGNFDSKDIQKNQYPQYLTKSDNKPSQKNANEQQFTYGNVPPTVPTPQTQQQFTYGNVPPTVPTPQTQQQFTYGNVQVEDIKKPSIEILNALLDTAISAAIEAGQIIVSNIGDAEVSKLKANPRDLLTEIDPLCEKVIKDMILKKFPDHEFLGEEDVDPGKDASASALEEKLRDRDGKSDYLWIVDPIDGTSNFVHGMPLCMPSIACTYKGETVIGVIFDPHRKEIFTAVKGHGARMNGEPIQVGQQATIGDAIIAMGSPPGIESIEMSLRGIQKLMPQCRTIRMLGSAALMLAWVANGRLTAYWEYDLSSWDIAAGALLISEAGGKFTDLRNEDYSLKTRKICGSNGLVHDELINILSSAGVS